MLPCRPKADTIRSTCTVTESRSVYCTVNIEFQGFSYLTSSLHSAFIKPKFTLIRSLIEDKSGLMEFLNGTVWTTSGDSVDNIWQ